MKNNSIHYIQKMLNNEGNITIEAHCLTLFLPSHHHCFSLSLPYYDICIVNSFLTVIITSLYSILQLAIRMILKIKFKNRLDYSERKQFHITYGNYQM